MENSPDSKPNPFNHFNSTPNSNSNSNGDPNFGAPKSKLENLGERLYSKKSPDVIRKPEHMLHGVESNLPTDFEHKKDEVLELPKIPVSLFTKIFIASLIFLFVSIGIAFYVYQRGLNVITPNNIDISISGPTTVATSDNIDFTVQVQNRNKVDLELADLIVDFPDGTRQVIDQTRPMVHEVYSIGTVNQLGTANKVVSASFFGETGTSKQVKFTFEYRIPGSNSIFSRQKTYDLTLEAAPLTLTVDSLKEVSANQEFSLKINVVSNAKKVIQNALISVAYPSGFVVKKFTPDPVFEAGIGSADKRFNFQAGNEWMLGDVEPGGSRTIQIDGVIQGQTTESKIFRVDVGSGASSTSKTIYTKFAGVVRDVAIKQPFIATDIEIEGTRGGYVSEAGKFITAKVLWRNTSNAPISDPNFELTFSSASSSALLLDESRINVTDGFYQSISKSIIWNSQTNTELKEIAPGQVGELKFFITLKNPTNISGSIYENPSLKMVLNVNARRLSENNVPENIVATAESVIAIPTYVSLNSYASYFNGPFTNTGPNPPKVDLPTTYTVTMSLANSFNNAKDVLVTTSLPTYVAWLGKVSPENTEKLIYDRNRNEVRWEVGVIKAGSGNLNSKPPRTVSFQVSILPSITQRGYAPTLTNQFLVSGTDAYTGVALSSGAVPVTTATLGDTPKVNEGVVGQ